MKILKENENTNITPVEDLPISFITDQISKGWDEVGYLKEAAAAVKADYKGTAPIEQAMQDLMDAYLIFIGQLELHLHKEDYIATTELEADNTDAAIIKELPDAEITPEDITIEMDSDEPPISPKPIEIEQPSKKAAESSEPFEFFVAFDEPDWSQPRLTDDELYGDMQADNKYSRK